MSEWLDFKESIKGMNKKKTKKFVVWFKCSDCELGIIKWYPQWRNYCFFPIYDFGEIKIFSDRCLLEISYFITNLNREHKNVIKQRKIDRRLE